MHASLRFGAWGALVPESCLRVLGIAVPATAVAVAEAAAAAAHYASLQDAYGMQVYRDWQGYIRMPAVDAGGHVHEQMSDMCTYKCVSKVLAVLAQFQRPDLPIVYEMPTSTR